MDVHIDLGTAGFRLDIDEDPFIPLGRRIEFFAGIAEPDQLTRRRAESAARDKARAHRDDVAQAVVIHVDKLRIVIEPRLVVVAARFAARRHESRLVDDVFRVLGIIKIDQRQPSGAGRGQKPLRRDDRLERQHAVRHARGFIRPDLPRDAVQVGQHLDIPCPVEVVEVDSVQIRYARDEIALREALDLAAGRVFFDIEETGDQQAVAPLAVRLVERLHMQERDIERCLHYPFAIHVGTEFCRLCGSHEQQAAIEQHKPAKTN